MSKTLLKKLTIKRFRALNDVEIEFGTHVTVICGKNGTSKSSILGIAAQIFSFDTDYVQQISLRGYKSITGTNFKSLPFDHFRFSKKYDVPGSLEVLVELHDGYTENEATAELGLSSREGVARPVLRKNTTAEKGKESRNFTHPVIFLSLSRLQPITTRDYKVRGFKYLIKHKKKFIALNNELLNKSSSFATGTGGSINSAVAHSDKYDQDSVSAGEDNAGQIILALMSFRKLKEEYPDYKGGLLLIDEADAGLFPAAQTQLLDILERECNELNLQVVMTSHSPTLIEHTYELSKEYRQKFKTVYLTDTFGSVEARNDFSWSRIYSDLNTTTVSVSNDAALPQVNIYFEDKEGFDFFKNLLLRHPCKKFINTLEDISLGCTNYVQLVRKGVTEFSRDSLIILDADVKSTIKDLDSFDSIVLLPGTLPPDQLIFEFLYNLPANNEVWNNSINFTKPVFTRCAAQIISELSIGDSPINLNSLIAVYRKNDPKKQLRKVFKDFYQHKDFQAFLAQSKPWAKWVHDNQAASNEFKILFAKRLANVMRKGHGIDNSKLTFLDSE